MLANIILAAIAMTTLPNAVRCPAHGTLPVSSVSDERLDHAFAMPWNLVAMDDLRAASTRVEGIVAFPKIRAHWYQGHAGGEYNGEFAAYDTVHDAFVGCMHDDTAVGFVVYRLDHRLVPGYVPRVSDGHPEFLRLHLGSNVADVRRLFGYAPLQKLGGIPVVYYIHRYPVANSSLPFVVETLFFVPNGRVEGMYRLAGF